MTEKVPEEFIREAPIPVEDEVTEEVPEKPIPEAPNLTEEEVPEEVPEEFIPESPVPTEEKVAVTASKKLDAPKQVRHRTVPKKVILRNRTQKERTSYTLKDAPATTARLAPTYKVLSKREKEVQPNTFKTKNPRARARIKRMVDRWGQD